MQSKKELKKILVPLLPCPPRSLCKTLSIECLAVILSRALRNPLQPLFSFSPHSVYCSSESAFAFCEAVHADSRNGLFHNHIHSLEFKRMDLEDAVVHNIAIAINCLSLRSVSFFGCRLTCEGIASLGESWHQNVFLHVKHFAFEECDHLPAEKPVKVHKRLCFNLDSIIGKFLPEEVSNSRRSQIVPALEHASFRNTLLSSSSKLLLTISLPALTNLVLLDISGTGEWTGKSAFLLGQCVSALPNLKTWRFDRVDLCQARPNDTEEQKPSVADAHMLLLGLRMKLQSEFSPIFFQEDWTYKYEKRERFQSTVTHLSFSHACSTPGMGSMALTSILNCFPDLETVDLSSSVISCSSAPRVFSQIHIKCPKLRQANFSQCSGHFKPKTRSISYLFITFLLQAENLRLTSSVSY
jgi:hypothetical protein